MSYTNFVITTQPDGGGSLIRSGSCATDMFLKQAGPGEYAFSISELMLPGEGTVTSVNNDPLFPTAEVVPKDPVVSPTHQTPTDSKVSFRADKVDFIEFTGLIPGTKIDIVPPVGSGLTAVVDAVVDADGILRITTDEPGDYRIVFEDPNGVYKPFGGTVHATN